MFVLIFIARLSGLCPASPQSRRVNAIANERQVPVLSGGIKRFFHWDWLPPGGWLALEHSFRSPEHLGAGEQTGEAALPWGGSWGRFLHQSLGPCFGSCGNCEKPPDVDLPPINEVVLSAMFKMLY